MRKNLNKTRVAIATGAVASMMAFGVVALVNSNPVDTFASASGASNPDATGGNITANQNQNVRPNPNNNGTTPVNPANNNAQAREQLNQLLAAVNGKTGAQAKQILDAKFGRPASTTNSVVDGKPATTYNYVIPAGFTSARITVTEKDANGNLIATYYYNIPVGNSNTNTNTNTDIRTASPSDPSDLRRRSTGGGTKSSGGGSGSSTPGRRVDTNGTSQNTTNNTTTDNTTSNDVTPGYTTDDKATVDGAPANRGFNGANGVKGNAGVNGANGARTKSGVNGVSGAKSKSTKGGVAGTSDVRKGKVPKTADQFNPALYLGLFAIGATGAAVVAKKRKED